MEQSPTRAPDMPRRIRFSRQQIACILLIVAVLAMAVGGVLSVHTRVVEVEEARLSMEVTYPQRARYTQTVPLTVSVENTSDSALENVQVSFGEDYVSGFYDVQFSPSPETVTQDKTIVNLGTLDVGESRAVNVEARPIAYWWIAGAIGASAAGVPDLEVDVTTWVLP